MDKVIFLPVPESFKKQLFNEEEPFPIDLDIPLPIKLPDDIQETDGLKNLTIDMIISGMLHVIEEKKVKQEWIDYYSGFVLYLRPDILEICQDESKKKYNIN